MFYCGIDLSATSSHLCVLDENLSIQLQQKTANELPRIVALLDAFKSNLRVVVESTFNWYWLVDGLQRTGFDVCLAHTLGLSMITAAKVKTDRRDAFSFAKPLRAGMIPKAYIYPAKSRPCVISCAVACRPCNYAPTNMGASTTPAEGRHPLQLP
jgi:transposase